MIVSIGNIQAHCRKCRGSEFEAEPGAPLRTDSELTCSSCGTKTAYRDLLEQIGERAMKQANESLAKLRGRKNERGNGSSGDR